MGKLRSKVRYAIHSHLNNEITEEEFQRDISDIINEFKERVPKKLLCQDIGLIVRERARKIPSKSDKFKRIWELLDQLEPHIREALNHWDKSMSE